MKRNDVICKCGHSINVHSSHGCCNLEKCSCQMAPHHIAIWYAAQQSVQSDGDKAAPKSDEQARR